MRNKLLILAGILVIVCVLVYIVANAPPEKHEHTAESVKEPVSFVDDHELHLKSGVFGGDPVSDGRTYSVLLIDSKKNSIPTGTELIVQGTMYQALWPTDGDCFRLMTSEHSNVQHGYDPRLSCRYSFLLTQKNTKGGDMWPYASLVCDVSPKGFLPVTRLYGYGAEVQVHGRYAPSLDFGVLSFPDHHIGTPLLNDCEFSAPTKNVVRLASETAAPIQAAPQPPASVMESPAQPQRQSPSNAIPSSADGQPTAPIERNAQLPSAVATSVPVLIYAVDPLYSEEARTKHLSGTVQVRLVVSAEGLPTNVQVTKSLGSGLDEAAINAVSQYRFKPARNGAGTAVPFDFYINVNFEIH